MKILVNRANAEIRLSFPDDCLEFNPTNNCYVSKCSQSISYLKDLWYIEGEEYFRGYQEGSKEQANKCKKCINGDIVTKGVLCFGCLLNKD